MGGGEGCGGGQEKEEGRRTGERRNYFMVQISYKIFREEKSTAVANRYYLLLSYFVPETYQKWFENHLKLTDTSSVRLTKALSVLSPWGGVFLSGWTKHDLETQ